VSYASKSDWGKIINLKGERPIGHGTGKRGHRLGRQLAGNPVLLVKGERPKAKKYQKKVRVEKRLGKRI